MNCLMDLMCAVSLVLIPSTVLGCMCDNRQEAVLIDGVTLQRSHLEAAVCDTSHTTSVFLKVYVKAYVNDGDDYRVYVNRVFKGPTDLDGPMVLKARRNYGSLCGLDNLFSGKEYYLQANFDGSTNTMYAGLCSYHQSTDDVSDDDVIAALDSYWCGGPISPPNTGDEEVPSMPRGECFRQYQNCRRQAFEPESP